MIYNIPSVWKYEITTIIIDLNWTLSVNWNISDRSIELIKELKTKWFELILLTWDQRGTAQGFCDEIWMTLFKAKNWEDKTKIMQQFNKETTAAIGNGRIDIWTFENSKLAIATLQSEWIHAGILQHVDIIMPSIEDALKIFLDPDTMWATMRI